MSAVTFDTHRIVKQLQSVGFTEEQAEVVTSVVQMSAVHDLSHFATREQLAAVAGQVTVLDGKVSALDSHFATREQLAAVAGQVTILDGKVSALDSHFATREQLAAVAGQVSTLDGKVSALDGKVSALDGKVSALEERIERRGAESDSRMMRWVAGTGVAAVLSIGGIVAGAVAFLLKALPLALH